MDHIQITDLNPSDSVLEELTDSGLEELTEEELLMIDGGRWFHWLAGAALITVGVVTSETVIGAALIGAGGAIIASNSSIN